MTIRLYYDDSSLTEFSAVVLEQRELGGKNAVILDRTAFYPTSGGQPHDVGVLGPARVVEVQEDPSGDLLHFVEGPTPVGTVAGRIDRDRRFDHMQQHTGQHILSQAFVRTAGAGTVSFHLGKETSTIDIELSQPSSESMEAAERLATQVVLEDRPVTVMVARREDLAALGVRKESSREGEIRVIDVEAFDRSPCGGTHVRRTGEIGLISVLGYERYKGGTRVEFVCGWRALKALRKDHQLLMELGRLYSSHPDDLARLTEKLFQERVALVREMAALQNQIFDFEAQDLVDRADKSRRVAIVKASFAGRGLDTIKILAQKVAAHPGSVAILADAQDTAQLVVARSVDVAGDCGAAVKLAVSRHGGKGGGKPGIAQAGGIPIGTLDAWLRELEEYFAKANEAGA